MKRAPPWNGPQEVEDLPFGSLFPPQRSHHDGNGAMYFLIEFASGESSCGVIG